MRVIAVVQARTGSSRLPGKVLRDLGGLPVLGWVVRAAQESTQVDQVVVATTTLAEDDATAAIAERAGAAVVRGPVDDVLTRFLFALDAWPADAVVRLTSDCPLLDPRLVDAVVGCWRAVAGDVDYVSTTLDRTFPRGLDVELVAARALRDVDRTATGHDRVHVTSAIWSRPERFRLLGLRSAPRAEDLRVTLDTQEDADLLDALVARLGSGVPAWQDVVSALRADPDLAAVNALVRQKRVEEG